MNEKPRFSSLKSILFPIATIVLVFVVLELVASYGLLLRLRITNSQPFTKTEPSYLSLINIPYKAGLKAGLFGTMSQLQPFEYQIKYDPEQRYLPDPELGYRPKPGRYSWTYSRRARDSAEWEHFRVIHTRKTDGTRWTGEPGSDPGSTVYIFGDSFVAGEGVNDEQTFSYLLQQARKDLRVRLFAVGGYGMTQAFIQFNRLRDQIRPNDIIILGYADYYDERNVMAPSWLRKLDEWMETRHRRQSSRNMKPKASVDQKGAIQISYVQSLCSENQGYCKRENPPRSEMTRVTAGLVNYIANNTEATTYLLYFDNVAGDKTNPVFDLIDDSIIKVSARQEDFGYFIRDDVEGFDPHPGPYWHYAISRKLLEALDKRAAAAN